MSLNTTDMNLATLQKKLAKVKEGKKTGMTLDQVIELLGAPGFSHDFGRTTHLVYKTSLAERTEFQIVINNADNTVSDEVGVNPILSLK